MYSPGFLSLTLLIFGVATSQAQNLVLTNDDGWAVAQIRAQYSALTSAGFDVSLSFGLIPIRPRRSYPLICAGYGAIGSPLISS